MLLSESMPCVCVRAVKVRLYTTGVKLIRERGGVAAGFIQLTELSALKAVAVLACCAPWANTHLMLMLMMARPVSQSVRRSCDMAYRR